MKKKEWIVPVVVALMVGGIVGLIVANQRNRNQQQEMTVVQNISSIEPTGIVEVKGSITPTPEPTVTPKPLPTVTQIPEPTVNPSSMPEQAEPLTVTPSISGQAALKPTILPWSLQKIIFIGDGRVQQMIDDAVREQDLWIYKDDADYCWLVEEALPKADTYISQGTAVVVWMGQYDTYNAGDYADTLKQWFSIWKKKGSKVYFASVGPVEQNETFTVANDEIMQFNTVMFQNAAGVGFIDVYNYLVLQGYKTLDGIKYDSSTAAKVYSYIINSIS